MSLSNLRSFAYNILKKLGDDVVKDRQFVEIGSCRECGNEILGLVYEPLTILACGHIYHRRCIEKNFLLTQSNICPTSDCSKSVEPVVTERRFSQSSQSSTSSIVRRMSNQLQINSPVFQDEVVEDAEETQNKNRPNTSSKRSNEAIDPRNDDAIASKPPVKKVKIKGVSSIVKKLIEELSSETSQDSEVMEEGTGGFFDLYNTIINMEGQEEVAKRDVIKSYYNFGKALEDRYDHYKKNNPKRTAQALVNKEVRKQLPDSVSDDLLRKKKEWALKIYDLFSEIGEHMIQRIKSFSVASISKLSQNDIDHILIKFAK